MQSPSFLASTGAPSPWLSFSTFQRFSAPFQNPCVAFSLASSRTDSVFTHRPRITHGAILPLRSTGVHEIAETSKAESGFVETGYICGVHGLQGEVRIKPNTDFPELRFSEPGRRWLRQQVSGKETIQEVDLLEGRGYSGQNGWIVKFNEIDTVDQAYLLVGSTMLVKEEDKPQLEEGEFYSRDLIGMRVLLKETGEPVGTVVNVFNTGANDLLHVMLNSSGGGRPKVEEGPSGPHVLVPFVEAIVPNVDMGKKEMLITPPKGLLELNIRSDERSKKERRQLEWKERKKFQKRLIAAKKKLCSMEQQHVFHGFRYGEKSQRSLLADQIVGLQSNLLQHALQNIELPPSKRWNLEEFVKFYLAKQRGNTLRIFEEHLSLPDREVMMSQSSRFQEKGHLLISEGKVATIIFVDEWRRKESIVDPVLVDKAMDSSCLLVEKFLHDYQRLAKVEDNASVPLVLVCPAHKIDSLRQLFVDHDYTFDREKVWFLEEEKLPVIVSSLEEPNKHKILMKSPWEILQTPVGSGGIVSVLSSANILENLSLLGVEYIKVCSLAQSHTGWPALVGFASSSEADVGIRIFENMNDPGETFDMVFSMKFMKHLAQQMNKLQFQAIPKSHSYVKMVEKEWVDVPSSPNSYELHCSIYSYLNASPPEKVCLMEVMEKNPQ